MSRDDLRALRNPLLLLAALLGLGAVLLHIGQGRIDAAERRLQQEESRMRDAQTRLRLSGQERELIAQHLPAYRELERAGFVAPEQRINWVSGLRTANHEAGLFGIEYQIGAQRPYRGMQTLNAPQLAVLESPMQLKVALLHEGDLMSLVAALAEQSLGLFVLEECTMKRVPGRTALRFEPQIDAECRLSWLTAHAAEAESRR